MLCIFVGELSFYSCSNHILLLLAIVSRLTHRLRHRSLSRRSSLATVYIALSTSLIISYHIISSLTLCTQSLSLTSIRHATFYTHIRSHYASNNFANQSSTDSQRKDLYLFFGVLRLPPCPPLSLVMPCFPLRLLADYSLADEWTNVCSRHLTSAAAVDTGPPGDTCLQACFTHARNRSSVISRLHPRLLFVLTKGNTIRRDWGKERG